MAMEGSPTRKVAVVGVSGSGKSTLSRKMARCLGLRHVELDAMFHQPGWTQPPPEEFAARVTATVAVDGWIVDGNYSVVSHILWPAADTVVWLDPPRSVVMRRIVRRTLERFLLRQELWNGNRERLRDIVSMDSERSIILWAWTRHPIQRERYERMLVDGTWSHLRVIRLRSPREVAAFTAGLGASGSGAA